VHEDLRTPHGHYGNCKRAIPEATVALYDVAFSDGIQAEDAAICDIARNNLHSSNCHTGRYSVKQGKGVHAFYQM
jgi:hypothetical protein